MFELVCSGSCGACAGAAQRIRHLFPAGPDTAQEYVDVRAISSCVCPSCRGRVRRVACGGQGGGWNDDDDCRADLPSLVVDFLDTFGGDSRFVLMGHSVGAYISLQVFIFFIDAQFVLVSPTR